jgi:hypothetical protein
MILVPIASRVREHEIGLDARRQRLASILDVGKGGWEKTIAKSMQSQLLCRISTEEQARAPGRLLGAPRVTTEDGPMHARTTSHETQHRSAASNLNIVGVSTQA